MSIKSEDTCVITVILSMRRIERRKSWAKSDCVLKIEEMHKQRDKMRQQRKEDLRAKKKEVA